MSLYKRILVPVDGSPTSLRGLKEAMRIAKDGGGKLWLLHVVDELYAVATPEAGMYMNDMIEGLRKSGKRILAKAEARVRASGISVGTLMPEIVGGPAASEIVRQAKKVRADLIVLGTHGRRGLKRLALGSDAEQVLRNASVPVLVIRAA